MQTSPKPTKSVPTAAELMAALAVRYPVGQFALLEQVANGTGSRANRWCDALAMSLWPSRGLELIGFELKSHRGDWLRELKTPEKAEAIAPYCHRWYVVAPSGVVMDGELPATWGLLELRGGKLLCSREAPLSEPRPLNYPMLAAILRRASETMVPRTAMLELARAEGEKLAENKKIDAELELKSLRRVKAAVDAFEQASGIRIDQYSGGRIGDDFKRFLEADRIRPHERLRQFRHEMALILSTIDRVLDGESITGRAKAA